MNHSFYMNRCLQLAALGGSAVAPNPMVGAVIVNENKIIGEGYHEIFGGNHAEVNAVNSVKDATQLRSSSLYVNLEPCSHYGKTPPCTNLIISSGIPRVYIGMKDPFAQVDGTGIQQLRAAGIEVTTAIEEVACRLLNKRFICSQTTKRPYIILKWAQSSDGFMGKDGEQLQISNELSTVYTHKWRHEEAAILVGAGTVIIDNPRLNNRKWMGKSPVRIISDRSGNLCENNQLAVFDGTFRTLVFTQQDNLNFKNAEVFRIPDHADYMDCLMDHLHLLGIQSVLVEGGSKIHHMLLEKNLWDECRIFIAGNQLHSGIPAPGIPQGIKNQRIIDNNLLLEIANTH